MAVPPQRNGYHRGGCKVKIKVEVKVKVERIW